MYEPRSYWELRGTSYLHEIHEGDQERRNWIRNMVETLEPYSILEVGCGPGKNFPAFKDVSDAYATDFSESALSAIPDRMGVNVSWMDSCDLKFEDRRFDLVVSCAHLVHIPYGEDQIERAVREICRVAKYNLLLMEFWDPEMTISALASHCFRHNYPKLIPPHGFVEVDRRPLSAKIGLFLFRRKTP